MSGRYRDLYEAVCQAEAAVEGSSLRTWRRSKDWHAHKEFLARRFRPRWGDDIQPEGGGTIVPVTIQFRYRPEGYDPGADPAPEVEMAVQVGGGPGPAVQRPTGHVSVEGLEAVDSVPPQGPPDPASRFVTRDL